MHIFMGQTKKERMHILIGRKEWYLCIMMVRAYKTSHWVGVPFLDPIDLGLGLGWAGNRLLWFSMEPKYYFCF